MEIDEAALAMLSPEARETLEFALVAKRDGDDYELRAFAALRDYPVSIEEFIRDPQYLGNTSIYPAILDELIELNNPRLPGRKYRARLFTLYSEAILTGGIGTGKTTIALFSLAYQLYVLSCFGCPHALFELDPASEIIIVMQNKTERLAKNVDYRTFRALIEGAPYFSRHFPFDPKIKSELRFPNNIVVRPVAGTGDAMLGQNVIGGIIDEVNFMDSVDRSRRSVDGTEYDQATDLYQTTARRRASRFMDHGKVPGLLFLVSSRRYPGQFTDRKEEERRQQLAETGRTSIYVYEKRIWEVKPGSFSGEMFRVFTGALARKPFILGDGEEVAPHDQHLVMEVPVEFRQEFGSDIYNALRDIAGLSTTSIHPFFTDRDAIGQCFGTHRSILSCDTVCWPDECVQAFPKRFHRPELTRFIHIDPSLTQDATGIVMGCVLRFVKIPRGEEAEILPLIHIDFALQIRPPKNGEISFERIREFIYGLNDLGLAIKFVTADGYQSADTIQLLRRKGYTTGIQSMDKDPRPYEILKAAIYDGRLRMPTHDLLMNELAGLERNTKTGKVDHPPKGSKDLADALAGVVYGLTTQNWIWAEHGVRPREALPTLDYICANAVESEGE